MEKLDSKAEKNIFPKFLKGYNDLSTLVRICRNEKYYLIPVRCSFNNKVGITDMDYQIFLMECYNVLTLFRIPEKVPEGMDIYQDIRIMTEKERIENELHQL